MVTRRMTDERFDLIAKLAVPRGASHEMRIEHVVELYAECRRARESEARLKAALKLMVMAFEGPGDTDSPTCIEARAAIAAAEGKGH